MKTYRIRYLWNLAVTLCGLLQITVAFLSVLSTSRALSPSRVVLSEAVDWCIFASPEKFNMAVTESDPDPKVQKMFITFYWLCDLWAEHAGMELKCYWF